MTEDFSVMRRLQEGRHILYQFNELLHLVVISLLLGASTQRLHKNLPGYCKEDSYNMKNLPR